MKKKKNRVTYIIIGLIYVIDLVKSFYPFLPCTFYIVVPVSNISNRSIYAPQKENTSRKQVLFLSFFFLPEKENLEIIGCWFIYSKLHWLKKIVLNLKDYLFLVTDSHGNKLFSKS